VAAPAVYPAAVFPFAERGVGVKGYGEKVSDLLFASLAASPALFLVDRADLKKVIEEQELNVSGMVAPAQATQVGQLTGAKVLITGSVIESDKSLYVVAKIIGTETSRVLGASVKGELRDELGKLAETLGARIAATVGREADKLVAKPVQKEDLIGALVKQIGDAKRPVVLVKVPERHVGQATVDPAAQIELISCCKEAGFEVVDPESGNAKQADVVITGEGFSEFATRHGNLISVKARLELRAVDRATDKVLAADRQVRVMVDLTEQIAGKAALQAAALDIALRLLPNAVKEWNKAKPQK
jgi:TolB-like protein